MIKNTIKSTMIKISQWVRILQSVDTLIELVLVKSPKGINFLNNFSTYEYSSPNKSAFPAETTHDPDLELMILI